MNFLISISVLLTYLFCNAGLTVAIDVELGNLVLNKTITRGGDEFYEAFASFWNPPKIVGLTHIKIIEKPSARWGSIVTIRTDEQVLWRTRVSNRARNIEELAKEAARAVMLTLTRQAMIKQHNNGSGDLAGDGL